jgi:iron(III) transport system substrate-binding protein
MQFGLTDNDDVESARREGGKLAAALPDQDQMGTLMIPTTVGLVKGSRNEAGAKKLIDYLLSSEVEKKLIDAKFAGWSVRSAKNQDAPKAMKVDYQKVVEVMPAAVRKATGILEGRE